MSKSNKSKKKFSTIFKITLLGWYFELESFTIYKKKRTKKEMKGKGRKNRKKEKEKKEKNNYTSLPPRGPGALRPSCLYVIVMFRNFNKYEIARSFNEFYWNFNSKVSQTFTKFNKTMFWAVWLLLWILDF